MTLRRILAEEGLLPREKEAGAQDDLLKATREIEDALNLTKSVLQGEESPHAQELKRLVSRLDYLPDAMREIIGKMGKGDKIQIRTPMFRYNRNTPERGRDFIPNAFKWMRAAAAEVLGPVGGTKYIDQLIYDLKSMFLSSPRRAGLASEHASVEWMLGKRHSRTPVKGTTTFPELLELYYNKAKEEA